MTLRVCVNEFFIFLTFLEHTIALPVKLIVQDNPDMTGGGGGAGDEGQG